MFMGVKRGQGREIGDYAEEGGRGKGKMEMEMEDN